MSTPNPFTAPAPFKKDPKFTETAASVAPSALRLEPPKPWFLWVTYHVCIGPHDKNHKHHGCCSSWSSNPLVELEGRSAQSSGTSTLSLCPQMQGSRAGVARFLKPPLAGSPSQADVQAGREGKPPTYKILLAPTLKH